MADKTLLMIVAVGDAAFYPMTLPRLGALANLMGSDLVIVRDAAWAAGMSDYSVSTHAWLKISQLPRFLPYYERIIAMDADILPNFANVRSREDLEPLLVGPSAIARDHGDGVTDDVFADWCRRRMPRGERVSPGMPYYNSGIMAMTRDFAQRLHARWEDLRPIPVERYNDQDFVNWLIIADKLPVQELPPELNWMEPQIWDRTWATAKLVHFAGSDRKPLIRRYHEMLPHSPSLFIA